MYNYKLLLEDALEQQIRLKDQINIFKESLKPKESTKKEKEALSLLNAIILLKGKEKVLKSFESEIFPKGK